MDKLDRAIADRIKFIRDRAADLVRKGVPPYPALDQATDEYEKKCRKDRDEKKAQDD